MQVSGAERTITVLGYLPLVALVLLIGKVRRDSIFVQFHVRQSWVLFLLGFATTFVLFLLLLFLPTASAFLLGLLFLAWAIYGFMMLAGMWKAARGERYRMPLVADVALMLRL